MTNRVQRNLAPLALGLLLVLLGGLFLAINVLDFRLIRFDGLRYVLPLLFLLWGLSKLVRHFSWNEEELARHPRRASLLSGLFWTVLGTTWLLALLGVLRFLDFFGLYWPLILMLFGLGKIIDYYRLGGRIQIRPGEVIGVFLIIFFGLAVYRMSEAHLPAWNFDFPGIVLGDRGIRIRGNWGETYRWSDDASEPIEGLQRLEVQNSFGDVQVEASSGERIEVRLTKEVVSDSEEQAREAADKIQIQKNRNGDALVVTTNRGSETSQQRLTTDLLVRAPAGLVTVVKGRHGDVRITNRAAAVTVDNSSGDVEVDGHRGGLEIVNEYGSVQVRRSQGEFKVENRRGQITLSDLSGSANIKNYYDDAIVRRLDGDLTLENRFGSVRISDVSGKVVVTAPGSSVSVSGAKKGVQVNNSQKSVRITQSSGPVELETAYSNAELVNIEGLVDLRATHSEITVRDVSGRFTSKAIGTRLALSGLEGGFDVVTTLRPVTIRGFSGVGVAQNEFDDISITTERALAGELTVINKNGNIELRVPSDAGFVLSAQAPSGRIRSDFENLRAEELAEAEGAPLLESTIGSGGPRVRLQTTQGQIRIRKGGRSRP